MVAIKSNRATSLPPWASPWNSISLGDVAYAKQVAKDWSGSLMIGRPANTPSFPIAWLPETIAATRGLAAKDWQPDKYLWAPTDLRILRPPSCIYMKSDFAEYGLGGKVKDDSKLAPQLKAMGINVIRGFGVVDPMAPFLPWYDVVAVRDGFLPGFPGGFQGNSALVHEPDKWAAGDVLEVTCMGVSGGASQSGPYSSHVLGYPDPTAPPPPPPRQIIGPFDFKYANLIAASKVELVKAKDLANKWRKVWVVVVDPSDTMSAFPLSCIADAAAECAGTVPVVVLQTDGADLSVVYKLLAAEITSFFGLNPP